MIFALKINIGILNIIPMQLLVPTIVHKILHINMLTIIIEDVLIVVIHGMRQNQIKYIALLNVHIIIKIKKKDGVQILVKMEQYTFLNIVNK